MHIDTPDTVVTRKNQENFTEEETVKEIISIGVYCWDTGAIEISIFSLICRKVQYHSSRLLKVNDYPQKFCFKNKFYFINNSKIKRDHLFRDGLLLL